MTNLHTATRTIASASRSTRTPVQWGGGGGNPPLRLTLTLLALAAAAIAIITADLTTPAQAQSDDETTGRIVARLLDDGRVEFGWQPTGGARVLPRQRYFPADATVDRWLRSSPVEVNGAEIGRINARLLDDGRIEFAFTPTDGERIEPPTRYFPTNARANRWLRSTEIAISPPAPGYIAISAGSNQTCAIRENGEIECWGLNYTAGLDPPEGSYTAVSAGVNHACAIRDRGEIACWGLNGHSIWDPETGTGGFVQTGQTDAPEGRFTAVGAGYIHTCAIHTSSGEIECWGVNGEGQRDAPEGRFTAVNAGVWHNCAIRENGEIACWGGNSSGGRQTDAPEGSYSAISAGGQHACAIRTSGEIACWGANYAGQIDAPEGSYSAVSAGGSFTCAIHTSTGAIECWGANGYDIWDPNPEGIEYVETGQSDAPEGSYTAVSAGENHACAIRASGAIECWGDNVSGQATPPSN